MSPTLKTKAAAVGFFGVAVILSGVYRILSREGGTTGLTFGLIMGTLALIGAAFLWNRKCITGFCVAGLSVAFVGGWFFYEALIKKGIAVAEPRQLIILGLGVLTAIILALPTAK